MIKSESMQYGFGCNRFGLLNEFYINIDFASVNKCRSSVVYFFYIFINAYSLFARVAE